MLARNVGLISLLLCVAPGFGCNMKKLAVNTQADVMEDAYPVIERQTDFQFAKHAAPGNLVQIEGLLMVSPDNEQLLLLATKGFASYAYGFLEDEIEEAEARGDLEQADEARRRAREMYLKAKGYGVHLLELMAPGISQSMQRDPDRLKRFLADEVTDESAAAALFWTGNAWGSAINVSRDDPTLVADLPMPATLVERAVELDEGYFHGGGHAFLGVFHASRSETIGGDPAKGKQHFERALTLTQRKALVVQFNYAQSYAIQTQNKQLFVSLLEECINAKTEANSDLALPNAVAARRAKRLLSQVGNYFFEAPPALEPMPESDPVLESQGDAAPAADAPPQAVNPAEEPPNPAASDAGPASGTK